MHFHHTDSAPAALGPYSQAVSVDGWLYTAGQVGIDPENGDLVDGGIEAEAIQVLRNLRAVLKSADCDFASVVKTTIYMTDLEAFATLNHVYEQALGDHRPARSTVEVAALPKGACVEIDMVARL